MATYSLYIANKRYSSWSMRPWVLMKALGVPFEEKKVEFQQGRSQTHFKVFSPTGKVPMFYDGELAVWDSLAICEYIAEKHPGAWPKEPAARAFARCAASEIHSGFFSIRDVCSMNVAVRLELEEISPELQQDIDRIGALVVDGLSKFGGPWLAGPDFSIADAFYAPVATRVQTYGLKMPEEALKYFERLLEHPAVHEWVKDGIRETSTALHDELSIGNRKVLRDLSKEE